MAKAENPRTPGKAPKAKASATKLQAEVPKVKAEAPARKTPKAKVKKAEPDTEMAGVVDTLYGLTLTVMGIAEFVASRDPGLASHLEDMLAKKGSSNGPHLNVPRSVIVALRTKKKPAAIV